MTTVSMLRSMRRRRRCRCADFLIYTDSSCPQADNLHIADDSPNSDAYYWNGCRIPWRLASDYVTSGDERSKNVTDVSATASAPGSTEASEAGVPR